VLLLTAVLLGAAGAGRAVAQGSGSAGCSLKAVEHGRRLERTIAVDGVQRSYILDVPDSVAAQKPVPLLFDFHGFGHSGAGVWDVSEFKQRAEKEGFVTVYPTGLPVKLTLQGVEYERPGWEISRIDGNRDLHFVSAMLDQIEKSYCIDRARVYSTGFSNGAFFSQLLACAMADRFAAVAPVSGGSLKTECKPSRPVPILMQHGRVDDIIPVAEARRARDRWIGIDGCREAMSNGCEVHSECRGGVRVEYCEGDFAHRWPPGATDRVWKFLQRYELKKASW
jgi:poly(3-hydroxybutyrate) depolymerase